MNINELQANLTAATEQAQTFLKRLKAQTAKLSAIASQEHIEFAKPFLTRTNAEGVTESVAFLNTLIALTGLSGKHKSNLAAMILAAILSNADNFRNLLGLKREQKDFVVVLIDTERNLNDQLPAAIQQIRMNAGFERTADVENFEYASLMPFPRNERLSALEEYFADVRKRHQHAHIVLLIDVISDLCDNFNDPKSAMPLLDRLNEFINFYDCTICAVIHQNPSGFSDKSRGHLGTELDNKSSTIITIGTDSRTEKFVVSCKKQRQAKPFTPFYVSYNAEQRSLEEDFAAIPPPKTLVYVSWELIFGSDKTLKSNELKARIASIYDCKETRAMQYINEAVKNKELTVNGNTKNRLYSLVVDAEGQPLF